MPVTFHLPGPLRTFSQGEARVVLQLRPSKLGEALEALWRDYPGIRDRVLTEQGQVREHINIFVGNEDIRFTGGLQTPLADGAEITILPAISGG